VTCNVEWAGETLTLTVIDHGIGIPQEDQARLFEPFHRARNTQHTQGTGLGLAIVKQSVEALGGAITIDSAVGQGTSVTVILPALPDGLTAHLTESSH
jgi:signal transduction histidine kinase